MTLGSQAVDEERRLVRMWLDDMQSRPINEKAWAMFVAQMRFAAVREQTGWRSGALPDGLDAVLGMVHALHELLIAHDFIEREKLPSITARLLMAIKDISEGRASTLFKPVRSATTRKRTVQANVSAIAALAVGELVKDGVSLAEAASKVARTAKAGRVAGHSRCNAERVKNWRARLEEGNAAATDEALMRYRAPLPSEAGETPKSRSAFLLAALRNSPALRY